MIMRELHPEEKEFAQILLSEWTSDLTPIEQRISIFSHIRDIPYAIIPEWGDRDTILIKMIRENRGWCGPKHILLTWMFHQLDIRTELIIIPFRWQDQPVMYPDDLRQLAAFIPDTNHLCSKAQINGVWQIIDATWDPRLALAGFPINDPWDGVSGTKPAVSAIDYSEKKQINPLTLGGRMQRVEFVRSLNQWLEELRHEKNPYGFS